ncbi:MAG: hypothetical protein LUM44_10560 [Pyrinomonadaceae bacterium]|nr:hypothetical protein [Pyrinomonadaceae bacterium]
MFKGKRGNYFWIQWEKTNLSDLLSAFPEIVINKYLVNTSFDSGSLTLGDEEIKSGWRKYQQLALSPPITNASDIPGYGYDEWYVFESPKTFENYEVFINYWCFSLENFNSEIRESFWRQIEQINPESFLAEGDYLVCVTKNESLFERITNWK